jgi:hypothetical protein
MNIRNVRGDQVIRDICAGNEPVWLVQSACKAAMARAEGPEERAVNILTGLGRLARAGQLDTIEVIRKVVKQFINLEDDFHRMVTEIAEEIRYILRSAGPEWEPGTIDMSSIASRRDDLESIYHIVLLQGKVGTEGARLLHALDTEVIAHFSVDRPQFSWEKYGGATELDIHTRRNDPDAWWVREVDQA